MAAAKEADILTSAQRRWILSIVGGLWSAIGLGETQAGLPLNRAEQEEFLRTADRPPPKPWGDRFGLEWLTNGQVTVSVEFNSLDVYRPGLTVLADGTRMFGMRDSYRYTIAAYELDKLLGLNLVPVTVERNLGGKTGAVMWKVDGVFMSVAERRVLDDPLTEMDSWNLQLNRLRVLTELIHDSGVRPTNLVVDQEGRIWSTGLSQTFHETSELIDESRLEQIDCGFYEALGRLSLESMRPTLSDYLSEQEMESLLVRRDRIIEVFDEKEIACSKQG